jgi:signal peptidase II
MPFLFLLISAIFIVFDQLSKAYIVGNFSLGESKEVLHGVLSFTFLKNDGAAWSILRGQMTFFVILTTIAILAALVYLFNIAKEEMLVAFAVSLILAGGVGNLIDRIRQGYVVDMIQLDFINFPIFNIADCCVVIGVGLWLIVSILEEKKG